MSVADVAVGLRTSGRERFVVGAVLLARVRVESRVGLGDRAPAARGSGE